jgi:hypothetical protein
VPFVYFAKAVISGLCATCTVHFISAQTSRTGRKQVYQYIKEAKRILSKYIYCDWVKAITVFIELQKKQEKEVRDKKFRGPREILARTSRIRGVIESIPRGIEE